MSTLEQGVYPVYPSWNFRKTSKSPVVENSFWNFNPIESAIVLKTLQLEWNEHSKQLKIYERLHTSCSQKREIQYGCILMAVTAGKKMVHIDNILIAVTRVYTNHGWTRVTWVETWFHLSYLRGRRRQLKTRVFMEPIKFTWFNVKLKGCRLHLELSWFRKIQSLDLVKDYKRGWCVGIFFFKLTPAVDRIRFLEGNFGWTFFSMRISGGRILKV